MASDDYYPRNPAAPQSIPLQDLSRPPDERNENEETRRIRNQFGGRARALLGNRQAFSGRVNTTGRYERVLAGSPPIAGTTRPELPHIATPRDAHQPTAYYDEAELSPVNAGEFQAAMGSVGLSFGNPSPQGPPLLTTTTPSGRSHLGMISEDNPSPTSQPLEFSAGDNEDYFPAMEDDRSPLTDERFLQPISGSPYPGGSGQRHDRQSLQSARSSPGSRLGDDLPNVEHGLRVPGSTSSLHRLSSQSTRSLSRSLSSSAAASPLSSAGTILRKMSQRVVNLSNEPEILDQTTRRQPSIKSATLEGPPSFPAMTEYAHDEPVQVPSPVEKAPPLVTVRNSVEKWQPEPNPLKGKSLGIFGPNNRIRLWLCELLVHPITEPLILILIVVQTILLAIDSAPSLEYNTRIHRWGTSWTDAAMLVLFTIYSFEILAKVIVSGLIKNADEYSTIRQNLGFKKAIYDYVMSLLNRPQATQKTVSGFSADAQPSILRSFTTLQGQANQTGHSRQAQRVRLARRAFLRHSFNRLDTVAVISFWISFVLAMLTVDTNRHIYVFKMLSCLRILRLLGLTAGTSIILRSLKKAAPLLVHVAFLIGFFWLLFAIIGVQVFKSSFRRTCVWFGDSIVNVTGLSLQDPLLAQVQYQQNLAPANIQFCGGHLDATTGNEMPYVLASNLSQSVQPGHKGFLCPKRSLCVEASNPYNGTVHFDNVLQSLEMVFVIMSSNTFSDIMYYTTDTDYLVAALFFAFGIVFMTFWLMNLLVAVITSSFQVIREESKTSAFTTDEQSIILDEEVPKRKTPLKRMYERTYWFWVVVVTFGLTVQCLRSANSSPSRLAFIDHTETVVTLVLLLEIFLRFITDWRNFHRGRRNWVDLVIAVVTAIIQLPSIHNSGMPYRWLTFFQIIRIYRVVLAVPLTRDLIMVVLGNVSGLLNLILFVFLITFLTSLFAVQIFRGEFPPTDISGNPVRINFSNIYNSFLGMYQVLSSENWTILMYNATQYDIQWDTAWMGATFFILWFILANFVVLNMFIAVIQENFDISEDEKRLQQVRAFLHQKELVGSVHSTLSLSTIFRWGREKARKDPLDYGPATLEMFKETVVRDFLDEQMEAMDSPSVDGDAHDGLPAGQIRPGLMSLMWGRIMGFFQSREPNPFYSRLTFSRPYQDLDPRMMAREIVEATEQRKLAQRQYLQKHPRYNVSLFLFKPSHPLRRLCQKFVGPGRGAQRIEGVDPVKPVWYAFSFFIYGNIVAMVLLACITTPLFQREYFRQHGYTIKNWFVWSDLGFAAVFTIEAMIKIIADGFFWTPNAYLRGTWGIIDGIVLTTLWINVATSLDNFGSVSRAVGAFKALRALRLLNVSDSARNTFHSVIVLGGLKVLSAAFVSLSLLIPFAVYGVNLFNGELVQCNDIQSGSIQSLTDCTGEWLSSPFQWNVLAPRRAANPYYDFDNFGNSLFILFQIVSQEGWIDVMWSAIGITGRGLQPQTYASLGNSVFFIVFNLLASVFVLTLFVSVFMRNYTEQTGVAFLTAEQRSWLELRKLLRQISPSKRPTNKPHEKWKTWCYRIAVKKHGTWQRTVTAALVLHLILLVVEFYPEVPAWEITRDCFFIGIIALYFANIVIRMVGLSWKRFRRSSWDLYSVLSVTGTIIFTILDLSHFGSSKIYRQLHKLFLVSIALLLIPRNNQLDQLFKTAAASLTAIGNLLATWFVLFLVYAIAATQTLGLTKFGSQGRANLNFRDIGKALILLFRTSCGESWNQIMEDFATSTPPLCVSSDNFFDSDCGSAAWARILFVSWNIISMYIFVSMFVSLIFESFSYVYQRSSGLSVVKREEIRRFKQAWATFDPEGTGYISKEVLPRLLGELSGVFEMRIYDGDHTVNRILEDCRVETRGADSPAGNVHGINLAMLNERLSSIDVAEIRRRRNRLEVFSQEVLVSADPDKGIAFTSCLMILAHYNVISDNKALRLEEFLRRRYRLQRVEEEVRRRVVMGFFDTLYWSRQFRRRQELRHSARMMTVPQFAVPEIFVDDQDGPSPRVERFEDISPGGMSSLDISRSAWTSGLGSSPPSPSALRSRGESFGSSPSRSDRSYDASPIMRPRRPSNQDDGPNPFALDGTGELSPHSPYTRSRANTLASGGSRSRAGTVGSGAVAAAMAEASSSPGHRRQQSSVGSRDFNALQVFDDSAWGESIKRSFSLRRNGTRGRRQRMGSEGRG